MSIIGAVIGGVGSLLGAKQSSDAAKDAGEAQAKATKYAADLQYKAYDQTRSDLLPYMGAGGEVLSPLVGMVTPRMSGDQINALRDQRTALGDQIRALKTRIQSGETGGMAQPAQTTSPNLAAAIADYQKAAAAYQREQGLEDGPTGLVTRDFEEAQRRLQEATGQDQLGRPIAATGGQTNLQARREQLLDQWNALNTQIQAGKTGPEIRDPYAVGQDSLYASAPQRKTQKFAGSVYDFDPTVTLDPSQYEASAEYEYLLGKTQDATVADAAKRGTRYSGAVAQALQENAAGLTAMDRQNWFSRQLGMAGNERANAALAMQGDTQWNALRDSNQAWNYGLGLDAYNRGMTERQQAINNMFNLAGMGQSAAAGVGNAGMSAANAAGNYATLGGKAQSDAIIGSSNAWSNAFNNIAGIAGDYWANRG